MLGGMQDFELRVSTLLDHAAREHPTREIVTHWADGSQTRPTGRASRAIRGGWRGLWNGWACARATGSRRWR